MAMCLANWSIDYIKYHGRWYSDAIYTYVLDAPVIMKSDIIASSMLKPIVDTHCQGRSVDFMGTNYQPGDILSIATMAQLLNNPQNAEWLDVKVVVATECALQVTPWSATLSNESAAQDAFEVPRDGTVAFLRRQPRG